MELTAAAVWLNTVFAEFDLTFTRAVHGLYEVAGGFFTPFFRGCAGLVRLAWAGHCGMVLAGWACARCLVRDGFAAGLRWCTRIRWGSLVHVAC